MVNKRSPKRVLDSYTVAEAARIVGVSPRRIRQLAEEGRLEIVENDPVKVLASDVIEFKKTKQDREERQASLPLPSPSKNSSAALLQQLLAAQEAGRQQAQLAITATLDEVRERAERAEQRASEAEEARRQAESSLAAIERELELEKARKKGLFNRR
jgi:DNA-binding transcriptional MerR regulator